MRQEKSTQLHTLRGCLDLRTKNLGAWLFVTWPSAPGARSPHPGPGARVKDLAAKLQRVARF